MAGCVDAVIRRNAKTARFPTKSIWTSDDAFEIHFQQRSTSVKLRHIRDDPSSLVICDQPGSCGSRAHYASFKKSETWRSNQTLTAVRRLSQRWLQAQRQWTLSRRRLRRIMSKYSLSHFIFRARLTQSSYEALPPVCVDAALRCDRLDSNIISELQFGWEHDGWCCRWYCSMFTYTGVNG